MKLFSNTIGSIENALNYSSLKQKVISENIANVDTPNYKAKDVSFKKILEDVQGSRLEGYRTDPRHFSFSSGSVNPAVVTQSNAQYNENGNSVDIDKEMSDLATNQIYFDSLVSQLNSKFSILQSVIKGGR
ncbi:flagellar basal body rod protein FlgB [Falsibacillus pallidus]|uniref:Flagellar basal body rod protein FlgB n=1 Tax=Falsibacillus pallidus TaxID=493781 RepID=A0A370GXX2_9BACI|nr:flagellar basal body rod protein FlgB [Falsibacillus pallidus]RDI47464.1 flagellar basal-body rod protein FlgB [Falsibacillus pallidus]